MPFLHWEQAKTLQEYKDVLRKKEMPKDTGASRYRKLLQTYILKEGIHPAHRLHVRRTLDQFYYHSLENTDDRDQSQVVTRYQEKFPGDPKVVAMVDQLWLWILVGDSGKADTIVTCFPTSQKTRNSKSQGIDPAGEPDPNGVTDVVQNVIIDLVSQTQLVETPYDLAGVIASQCSRIFLNPSTAARALQFSEVYWSAIGAVVSLNHVKIGGSHSQSADI